jgi:hypothetical protein
VEFHSLAAGYQFHAVIVRIYFSQLSHRQQGAAGHAQLPLPLTHGVPLSL